MKTTTLTVNGKKQSVELAPDTPLSWVLRGTLGLTGTKCGGGINARAKMNAIASNYMTKLMEKYRAGAAEPSNTPSGWVWN
jgi:aerobic-type carbon monoxide dehydrogenase small subunit (CoxS/CutS family)